MTNVFALNHAKIKVKMIAFGNKEHITESDRKWESWFY